MAPQGFAERTRAKAWVFVAAVAIGAIDLGSYAFLTRSSVDFIVARREAKSPAYHMGTVVSWTQHSPGALFGWSRPQPAGTWSVGPVAALAVRLAERPHGNLLLTASVTAFVDGRTVRVRHVDVLVNGAAVAEWRFEHGGAVERTARIPGELVRDDRIVRVEFRFRELYSPSALGTGRDRRKISLMLSRWRLDPG